jgi:6,7-dimethyl-8-ribityllumazine synthase
MNTYNQISKDGEPIYEFQSERTISQIIASRKSAVQKMSNFNFVFSKYERDAMDTMVKNILPTGEFHPLDGIELDYFSIPGEFEVGKCELVTDHFEL